ncbi:MAG: trigger factor [Oscillospiraceae bacterium]|nr:trigger factor [Oscillospiraceae bacterium]
MTKLLKKENNIAEFEIEIGAEDFASAIAKAYGKAKNKISVPGFRKGKTPQKIIENYYGDDVFFEDAVNEVLPARYEDAIRELELAPIDRPNVETKELSREAGAVLSIKVECEPEVQVKDYLGVKIPKIVHNVKDEDVKGELEALQARNARTITANDDYLIKTDDIATIDFEGFIAGEAFEGGKGDEHPLVIGSNSFIPGFEEQLIGMKKGEAKDVKVTFPKDYHSEEHAGKEAVFKVEVKKVEVRELPKIDDDFAQDVSEFDTLAEFKASIKEKLAVEAEKRAKAEKEDAVIDEIIKQIDIDIPEVMIRDEIQQIARRMEHSLAHQGIDLETYMQITGMTPENFVDQNRERAINQVKANLALKKIAKLEGIEISEDELAKKYEELAEVYKQPADEVKKMIPEDAVKADMVVEKTIELLVSSAKVK